MNEILKIRSLNMYTIKTSYILVLLLLLLLACDRPKVKILRRFSSGKVMAQLEFPDNSDTSHFFIKTFYQDGEIKKEAEVRNHKYVRRKIVYFKNGGIYQIDSISKPCDTSSNACDGELIRYNDNGTISQRFAVQNNQLNGLSEHYDSKGVLVKTYYLVNNTIKNGEYKEYYPNGNVALRAKYQMDTIVGYEYYFKDNGDTLKFFFNDKGQIDFPYKKWLEHGSTVYGIHLMGQEVLWTWRDSTGRIIKQQTSKPTKNGYTVPDDGN
jgi:antitoxin component YwqK of YwqJK toxin-antitoxin module